MKPLINFLKRFAVSAVISIGLLVVGAKADATELAVGVHTVSVHTEKTFYDHENRGLRPFNNTNGGLYLRASSGIINTSNVTVGFYRNSVYRSTVYATIGLGHNLTDTINIGGQVGLATGYNKAFGHDGSLMPIGGLTVSAKLTKDLTANVIFVPPVGEGTAGVVHLTFDHKF